MAAPIGVDADVLPQFLTNMNYPLIREDGFA